MFDTQYNVRGMVFFGDMFGSCSSERADRSRTEAELNSLPGQIENLERTLNQLKNGSQQKLFDLLKKDIDTLLLKKSSLEAEKIQAMKLLNTWRDNPEVAAQGLGIRFTCNDYRNQANNNRQRMLPLKQRIGVLQGEIKSKNEALSEKNMNIIRDQKKTLETTIEVLDKEIKAIHSEIVKIKDARQARIEAEKLAAEQERQKREQEAMERANQTQKANQQQMILLLGGAAVLGFLFLSKRYYK